MDEHQGRAPAPGALGLIEDFVNSLDYPQGPDELATPESARSWLAAHGVETRAELTEADCGRLRRLRESMRDLLEAHTGRQVPPSVRTEVTRLLGAAPLSVRVGEQGTELTPVRGGIDAALGRIAAAMVEASLAGTWPRLKVCVSDSCRFAFYDHSKNGSGMWCTMRVCGSRAKARAYRERRRSDPARR